MMETVGIAAVVALIIRELFSYLKSREATERSSKARDRGSDLEQIIRAELLPIMTQQTAILMELKNLASVEHDCNLRLQVMMEGLKFDSEKIRTNLHNINNALSSLANHESK